jgi:uncharacterized protein
VRRDDARVALVTGATAGLGREFCEQLAASGHDIVAVARDTTRLEALARDLAAKHGVRVEVVTADLSTDEGADRVIARIADDPAIDVLVNNAGFGTRGSIAAGPSDPQDAMLRVHVMAPMRLAQAAVKRMVERGRGRIIDVSSVASFLSSPGNVNYCATKAYLRVFSEGLAQELEGKPVVVQALCPGFTHTEFHQRAKSNKAEIPSWLWMNADRVIRESLHAVNNGGPVVVIPGIRYKILVAVLRHAPIRFLFVLARRYRRDR